MKLKLYILILLAFLTFQFTPVVSQAGDTIPGGSFLINMGVTPQTVGNGLKPYGLVYELLNVHRVPVYWVVNAAKGKDGIDFSHNGTDYRGGTFIVPFEYRTTAVNAVILNWQTQGVIGANSSETFVVEGARKLYFPPRWTLDKTNGMIAVDYFVNAGIPESAYGGDSSSWRHPSELGACDDIFVMPHADPTWASHENLYQWNLTHKGNIWAGCHGVSAMENLKSPDGSIQMNFLTTDGMVPTQIHRKESSPPYIYSDHGHPVMQFMGVLDNATINGSERIFLPVNGGGWRNSTSVAVYDTTDKFIPSLSQGPAAAVAFGRAYGDANRGYVMYQSGHSLTESGSIAEQVAAQRAFFNYSFFVAAERYAGFEVELNGLPSVMTAGVPVDLSLSVPEYVDLSAYSILWTSTGPGTFSPDSTSPSVTYQPAAGEVGPVIITVSLTDACSRVVNSSEGTFISSVLASGNTPRITRQPTTSENKIIILGNPILHQLSFQFDASQPVTNGQAQLISADGKIIRNKQLVLSRGRSVVHMASRSELSRGMYYLRIFDGREMQTSKIMVN